jgi:hypothetical protein
MVIITNENAMLVRSSYMALIDMYMNLIVVFDSSDQTDVGRWVVRIDPVNEYQERYDAHWVGDSINEGIWFASKEEAKDYFFACTRET